MKTIIDIGSNLILGMTQRCNAACKFCQCGNSQNIDMSKTVMEKLFEQIKHIKQLVLLGGEPFLAPETLCNLIDVLKSKKTFIDYFTVFTNGTVYDEKYLEKLGELKELCKDKDECNLLISYDKVHRKEGERLLGAEKYHENVKKLTESKLFRDFALECDVFVVDDGRAKNLDNEEDIIVIPQHDELKQTPCFQYTEPDKYTAILVSTISVSALGDISLESDFDQQKKRSWGNVTDRNLNEIILSSPMAIKCQSLDEYNANVLSRNKKLHAMKIYSSMKRLKMSPDSIDKFT